MNIIDIFIRLNIVQVWFVYNWGGGEGCDYEMDLPPLTMSKLGPGI